jgi:hypothetical protein
MKEQGNDINLRQTLFMHNALLKVALRTVSVTEGRTVKRLNSVAH